MAKSAEYPTDVNRTTSEKSIVFIHDPVSFNKLINLTLDLFCITNHDDIIVSIKVRLATENAIVKFHTSLN
jgi:hypothetical protein